MGEAVQMVEASRKEKVLPLFISVDPARDGVKEVNKYIRGELPSLVPPLAATVMKGLRGRGSKY